MAIEFQVGPYIGEVVKHGLSKAQTGSSQFYLTCKVFGKPDPKDAQNFIPLPEPHKERTVFRVINENTVDFVLEDLAQLGFAGTSFGQLDSSHPQFQSFVGKEVDLYCKHETYNGSTNERWQLSRPGGMDLKPLEASDIRSLDTMFGSKLKQVARTVAPAARTAAAPKPNGVVITDDDIAF